MVDENKDTSEPEKPRKLTPDDPVPPDILARFTELEDARVAVALQLLNQEENRVRLLSAAHTASEQRKRLFEQVLVERGLSPLTQVEIDSKTGVLRLLSPPEPPEKPPA